jgi:hypothetical protein
MIRKSITLHATLVALLAIISLPSGAVAKECTSCHREVLRQFNGTSHHVQGTDVTGRHCYSCHWEATEDGEINKSYHNVAAVKGRVDLVIWDNGKRPTKFQEGVNGVTFRPAAIGTDGERAALAGISKHCLGCHGDGGTNGPTFASDPNVPQKYAWDGMSIASRYLQKETTSWGKYSTATTNKKARVVKAFSPHGNATANQGGWLKENGYDGNMPITRGGTGARNVECFDCHNSHGSVMTGVTSSYRGFDGSFNSGILKETVANKGGYRMNYRPSSNTYSKGNNPFNAGAGLCFDCHETPAAGTTPWGYTTFGASEPIMGYKDTPGFGSGSKGSTARYANRHGREEIASSHLKAGKPLDHSPSGQINGLCTPCHDPHGISRTLGDKGSYAVPLLKGSWLTSPYREDGPPTGLSAKSDSSIPASSGASRDNSDFNRVNRDANSNFAKQDATPPRKADFNSTNREANANFGKGDSGAARTENDFNRVNRDANSNFAKQDATPPRKADFNSTNREANANFGKGDSGAARTENDFNRVNRDANSNFAKQDVTPPRKADFNSTNREANANFGKGDSGAARTENDFNRVNRDANSNFAKQDTTPPRKADFNNTNLEANANFGKGTSRPAREFDANTSNRDMGSNFGKSGSGAPREPMQGMKYNVDRNTFNGNNRIAENDDTFGGLCLKCHTRESLTGETGSGLVHRAVKGWGNNKEHSFPCSKCHQAHNSGLPRLMQTNCFELGPSGLRENSGLSWLPYKTNEPKKPGGTKAAKGSSSAKNKVVGCHVRQFGKTTTSSLETEERTWTVVNLW